MKTETVSFYSEGAKVAGILRLPDDAGSGPRPGIVQGPGWLGLKDSKLYERYHRSFTEAGYVVLVFDYRGFGGSEGDRTVILPQSQADDIRNAIAAGSSRRSRANTRSRSRKGCSWESGASTTGATWRRAGNWAGR